jgi:two-component system, OmpR family, KDP operon response regulator KdpE
MKKTILVADEDESVRESLARVLESEQYQVLKAREGREAENLLLAGTPDLALLDLELSGGMDWRGLDELCDAAPWVPVLLITARSHRYKRALQLGADALMEKPLHLPILLKTIRNLVREPASDRLQRILDPAFQTLFLNHLHHPGPSVPGGWQEERLFESGK